MDELTRFPLTNAAGITGPLGKRVFDVYALSVYASQLPTIGYLGLGVVPIDENGKMYLWNGTAYVTPSVLTYNSPFDTGTTYPAGSLGAELLLDFNARNELQVVANQTVLDTSVAGILKVGTVQDIGTGSDVQHRDMTIRRIKSSGVPPVAVWGTGAGADSTPTSVSITGDSSVFDVTFTPSATPAAGNAVLVTFAFATAYAAAPKVDILGNDRATRVLQASLASGCNIDGAVTTAGFAVNAGSTALGAGPYKFRFRVWGT